MTYQELKDEEQLYLMHTYGRFPAALDHGKGATLWDTDGKKYIDLTSGIGVSSLGHDNEALVSALNEQAHKLLHASNLYLTEPMVQVAKELVTSCGMGKIFFSNSLNVTPFSFIIEFIIQTPYVFFRQLNNKINLYDWEEVSVSSLYFCQ